MGISVDGFIRKILIDYFIPPSRKFFCLLYAAVHCLIKSPICYKVPCVVPTKQLELVEPITRLGIPRVFKHKGYVYKLYDTTKDTPNMEVVLLVLPEAIYNISQDGQYQMLKYKFKDGEGQNMTSTQVSVLLQQLHIIHEKGFVHSDVRYVNIVVSGDGKNATIIDFDLACKEDTNYPETFNREDIQERHESARKNKPQRKIYDVFALDVIVKKYSKVDIKIEKLYTADKKSLLEISSMV